MSATQDAGKEAAARFAASKIADGARVGLGTGSTSERFVRALGERVRAGLKVLGVPTSESIGELAAREGISLGTLDAVGALDVDVDGADAVDPQLNLVKGLGGALLREKIVAASSARFVVIVDDAKLVTALSEAPRIPVEIVPFGWSRTAARIESLGATVQRRMKRGTPDEPFVTDGGHYILDVHFAQMDEPARAAASLKSVVGVVEHGLFLAMATEVIVGDAQGRVRVLHPT